MADESDKPGARGSQSDPLAIPMAVTGASREEADAFLRRQRRLVDLQIGDLEREDEIRHWSLRVRHVSDVMRVTFELTVALIGLTVIVLIASAVWMAAHDNGLVIEAFNVPPDMAAKGLTGDVVASQLLDGLTLMQSQTDSSRAPGTYSGNFGNDIKIEIPNTGISISEAYRYLAGWLGHQTHISGEVYRTQSGMALTVRTSNNVGSRFDGNEADLDKLVTRAAERIYNQTQPFRFAVYLLNHGRVAEGNEVLKNLALNGPPSEKPWAYALWMYLATGPDAEKDMLDRAHEATGLDPQNMLAQMNAATADATAGHDEGVLREALASRRVHEGGRGEVTEKAALIMGQQADSTIAEEDGDYQAAAKIYATMETEPDFNGSRWTSHYMLAVDDAKMHDPEASLRDLDTYTDQELFHLSSEGSGYNQINFDFPQFQRFAALDKWQAARKDMEGALATKEARDPAELVTLRSQAWPWLALADAKSGDPKSARATIAKTRLDCYLCLRVRGDMDALVRNWNGAEYWYASAVKLAPSIPFAYTARGAMLLWKGDFEGAIANFNFANHESPHFADPIEMWGEALIAKNRSDLALAKFAEADKYAPNWGRLHLKWGEALLWSGKADEAKKQFQIAHSLDLTTAEQSELARMKGLHG